MRAYPRTASLGFLIGVIVSNCGGATSGSGAAPANEASSGEPGVSVSGTAADGASGFGARDGAASDAGGRSRSPASGGQDATIDGSASDTGGLNQPPALDGQAATVDGRTAFDTGGSNDVWASDVNRVGACPSSGASDGGQPVPQVFASVSLGPYFDPNHNGQNTCNSFKSLTEVFSIGTATGSCATVNVMCSVTGSYDIYLQASLGATGNVLIAGHVDAASGGQGLSADITYQSSDYQGSFNCAVTFTYAGAPVPQNPPIAPGRIWAHLSCPQMGDPNGTRHVVLMDLSQVPEACDGEVDFVFENCVGADAGSIGESDAAPDSTGHGGSTDASGAGD